MSSGKNPLMLMMALTMPGAVQAIGLGDIHVDSALNERFAAEIDILGATALELADLRAAVANQDTFLRFGADRPAFLSSATFKVAQDAQGRPVLAVRSTESFTEPVVNFLVDLNWHNGELVRQYTLLLDPADFAPRNLPAVPTAVVSLTPSPSAEAIPQTPAPVGAPDALRKTTHIKVGARATLRGIAWRVGERSESDLQRMMIATFRANPSAFEGNINRLRLGAVLTIPQQTELSAISKAEASREFHAQMAAWRSPVERVAVRAPAAQATVAALPTTDATIENTSPPAPVASPSASASPAASASRAADETSPSRAVDEALNRRVHSLEHELNDMQGLLQTKHDQVLAMQAEADRSAAPEIASLPSVPAAVSVRTHSNTLAMSIVAGLGILASALAALYAWLRHVRWRRRPARPQVPITDGPPVRVGPAFSESAHEPANDSRTAVRPTARSPVELTQEHESDATTQLLLGGVRAPALDELTQPLLPTVAAGGAAALAMAVDPTVRLRVETVNLRGDTVKLGMDPTRLDYNLVDLDLTAQHVQMPSVLNEQVVVQERRTNFADVLRAAIDREPDRHDLRMKLLELYYSAAATNRQGFLEVVQRFAVERNDLQTEEWDKIAFMGRQIASENPLFAEDTEAEDDIADCA